MKIVLVGYGNVGKELEKLLLERSMAVDCIVRSSGIFDSKGKKIDLRENFLNHVSDQSVVFISVPSVGSGEEAAGYYTQSLSKGARVITCEKAFLAHNWGIVDRYKGKIKYSATVGGASGMLQVLTDHKGPIREIKAVVNGTLNYVVEGLNEGLTHEGVYKEAVMKGFAEPGCANFDEMVTLELKDVAYKAAILANHSRMRAQIVVPEDMSVQKYEVGLRCAVIIDETKIQAGFVALEEVSWLPKGVNNVLYVNGRKIAEGPGAGGRITAERMVLDMLSV